MQTTSKIERALVAVISRKPELITNLVAGHDREHENVFVEGLMRIADEARALREPEVSVDGPQGVFLSSIQARAELLAELAVDLLDDETGDDDAEAATVTQ